MLFHCKEFSISYLVARGGVQNSKDDTDDVMVPLSLGKLFESGKRENFLVTFTRQ